MTHSRPLYRIGTVLAANMRILLLCTLFGGLHFACDGGPPPSNSVEYAAPDCGDAQKISSRHLFTPSELEGLVLTLESSKPAYGLGEPLTLRVIVTNYDKWCWAFPPSFFPEGVTPDYFPLSELRFEIENRYGIPVDRIGDIGQLPFFKAPSLCEFIALCHARIFGRIIVINEGFFAYAFPTEESREYTIRAVLRVFSQEYVRRGLSSEDTPTQCKTIALDRVYNGRLVSNPITIEYGELPPATGLQNNATKSGEGQAPQGN
ncbi:MAG: hypothetical protein GY847_34895 [Proteobacteria bacterium]|nr:hypothetical protein [Pseudomonadota bacterium]